MARYCLLLGSPKETRLRAREILSTRLPVKVARSWSELRKEVREARCAVLIIEWLDDVTNRHALKLYRRHYPLKPIVLITNPHYDNLRYLSDIVVDDIVFTNELTGKLLATVRRACASDPFRELGIGFRNATHLPSELRTALALAVESRVPIRSQKELSDLIGCTRTTLAHQWNRVRVDPDLSFKVVLDSFVLLCALARKTPGLSWNNIADEIHTHPHTLARIAKRITGMTLRSLASSHRSVSSDIVTNIVRPLLPTAEFPELTNTPTQL